MTQVPGGRQGLDPVLGPSPAPPDLQPHLRYTEPSTSRCTRLCWHWRLVFLQSRLHELLCILQSPTGHVLQRIPSRNAVCPGLTWFALWRTFLLLLLALGRAFLPRRFKLQPVARNIQAGRDGQLPERGCRRRRGYPWWGRAMCQAGRPRPSPSCLPELGPLGGVPTWVSGHDPRLPGWPRPWEGKGTEAWPLRAQPLRGDLLGEAERGWEQTRTVTPHTRTPARQDHRLLCPRGKGPLDQGCL